MKSTQHLDERTHSFLSSRTFILLLIALFVILLLAAFSQDTSRAVSDDGERVYNQVCATCHTINPPAAMGDVKMIAPPMRMILMHYRAKHESDLEVRTALESWLELPAVEKSALPAMAIEHHGLMPPLTITAEERKAVVTYVMNLSARGDSTGMGHMRGMMQGRMQGQMQGNMQGMDHSKMDSTKHKKGMH